MHNIAGAWTGIGAAVYALWQQTKVASSTWTMLGVVSYLACVSTLQTASTTIMQFTAFNSYSIIPIQSAMTWPNATVIAGAWGSTFMAGLPPSSLLSSIQAIGLVNNTLYDILTTTNSSFANATVNATSLQSTCGLLSNLTFQVELGLQNLSFSNNGLGSGNIIVNLGSDGKFITLRITYCGLFMAVHNLSDSPDPVYSQITRNQIVLLSDYTDAGSVSNNSLSAIAL